MRGLPTPEQIKNEFPLTPQHQSFIESSRYRAEEILRRKQRAQVAIIGPCSIHDPESALEYAHRLKKLGLSDALFPVMRFFIEKPRTRLGWKGLLYDPHLDGSNDIAAGIRLSRKLLLEMAELAIPCACELLDPLAISYFDDLLTWGLIGARTSASQPHRQLASGLPFPVGFKNGIHGELDVAVSGVLASRLPHTHIGIDKQGRVAAVSTAGNPQTHVVLRGAETKTNFDASCIEEIAQLLREHHIDPRILIDCAHGNCGRDPQRQKIAFKSVVTQVAEGNDEIIGVMLESHLQEGKQPLLEDPSHLTYGVSVTDPCLGWNETEELLLWADEVLSISMDALKK